MRTRKKQDNHGLTKHPCYGIWVQMRRRCEEPKSSSFHLYGGRGIRVCERWSSFENFLADMGERPAGTTLDRYPDQNGNYAPSNCRWATFEEQNNNRRNVVMIEHAGERLSIAQWARKTGINVNTLYSRHRVGLDAASILATGSHL